MSLARHPDKGFSFAALPIPVLLLMRFHKLEFVRANPHEAKKAMTLRWEQTLLGALYRKNEPVDRCLDCGARWEYHVGYCVNEVAA